MRSVTLALLLAVAATGCKEDPPDDTDTDTDTDSDTSHDWRTVVEGLDVRDATVGDGDEVKKGNMITFHYTIWLYENGEKTDEVESTHRDDTGVETPAYSQVGSGVLMDGWDIGIPGMREGGVRELITAPEWAFGERGFEDIIPPNATLFSEIELERAD